MLETMVLLYVSCQKCNYSTCSKQSTKVVKSTVFHSVSTSSHLSISELFGSAIGYSYYPPSNMHHIYYTRGEYNEYGTLTLNYSECKWYFIAVYIIT